MLRLLIAGIASIAFFSGTVGVRSDSQETGEPRWMFIQRAEDGSFDGMTLTLHGVAGQVIAFSERPDRMVRSISTQALIDQVWQTGPDSFDQDPPNAAITFEAGGNSASAVIELNEPTYDGATLSYRVRLLQGDLPSTFADPIVIIDPPWNDGPSS